MDIAELSEQEAIKHTSNWISQFVFLLSRKRQRRAIYILYTYTAIVIAYIPIMYHKQYNIYREVRVQQRYCVHTAVRLRCPRRVAGCE